MKKKLVVLGLVVMAMLAMLVPGAFAAGTSTDQTQAQDSYTQQAQDYFNQMFEWRKAQVDQMLSYGYITEEQAKAWKQQIDSMKDYMQQNGNGPMMGNGYYGMGPGMMGGGYYGWCW
ncbi:DUF2680 domain-containing protein [Desulfotomaculum nigrificans]|uniref:DUF2680 domain-containing protein n=1 Tax=Desulfotomaculum nigrificans TaxID=1565 RepID=UPI0001FAE779|nr:DUF2680 domain-containing protein [Desulfotomaculum nigrificans]MDA8235906.1 DUF2680 domain-containing protein [Clostridia bacterium]